MMHAQAAVLQSLTGESVPLLGVRANGRLDGLLFELTVEQRYRNSGTASIEMVYTIPLPHRAVLLGFDLELGEHRRTGVVVARKAASETYEAAIDAGDTAALLEQTDSGLYTVSLGNLQSGEEAVIRYRYAELLDRHGRGDEGYVRLMVPVVVAPRYGSPAFAGLDAYATPTTDLTVEYPFALQLDILGRMAEANLASPSHSIATEPIEGGCRVTLRGEPQLDRDFVLQVTGAGSAAAALTAPDGDAFTALVSLEPGLPRCEPKPLALKLLVDCSGSMAGDSIAAAQRAISAILDRLHEGDALSVTRFGNDVQDMTDGLIPATGTALQRLRRALPGIDAYMGGTEMVGAVQHVLGLAGDAPGTRDILLITDGQVWSLESLLETIADAGHRLFVVAVGAAPNESLARQLAETTGGACEFIGPSEDAEAAIVRMYQRMRAPLRRITRVAWPAPPAWQGPLPKSVFPGDTLHLFAGFPGAPCGEVVIEIEGEGVAPHSVRLPLGEVRDLEALPRVAAARRLFLLPLDEASSLAERQQLVSPWTSFVVTLVRTAEEKASSLPDLKQVGQMLPAGWGGTGSVLAAHDYDIPAFTRVRSFRPAQDVRMMHIAPSISGEFQPSMEAPDLPEILSRVPAPSLSGRRAATPSSFLRALAEQAAAAPTAANGFRDRDALERLEAFGLPAEFVERLRDLAVSHPIDSVVEVFLAMLAASAAGDDLPEDLRRVLLRDVLTARAYRELRRLLKPLVDAVASDRWDLAIVETC